MSQVGWAKRSVPIVFRVMGTSLRSFAHPTDYLYRVVIAESNIVACHNGEVTFRYQDSKTGQTCTRTLKREDFLWLVLRKRSADHLLLKKS